MVSEAGLLTYSYIFSFLLLTFLFFLRLFFFFRLSFFVGWERYSGGSGDVGRCHVIMGLGGVLRSLGLNWSYVYYLMIRNDERS